MLFGDCRQPDVMATSESCVLKAACAGMSHLMLPHLVPLIMVLQIPENVSRVGDFGIDPEEPGETGKCCRRIQPIKNPWRSTGVITALALGGADTDDNCQAACQPRHRRKTSHEGHHARRNPQPDGSGRVGSTEETSPRGKVPRPPASADHGRVANRTDR